MAKILAIKGPFYELSRLINEAERFLLLISPYIILHMNSFRS